MESDYTAPCLDDALVVRTRVVLAILVLVFVFDVYLDVPLCQERCSLGREVCAWIRYTCLAALLLMISQRKRQRERPTYFRLLAQSVAAQLFGCFGLLEVGPYRMEIGGVTRELILPLGLMDFARRKCEPFTEAIRSSGSADKLAEVMLQPEAS